MALTIEVITPQALVAAAERLRQVDDDLPKDLRYLLGRAVRPIMRQQRAAVRSLPGDGGRGIDLRNTLAKGLRLTVRTGGGRRGRRAAVRIRTTVPGSSKKPNLAALPRGLDTHFGGWRSPFFGNTSYWVHHQTTGDSWFMGPPSEAGPDVSKQVKRLLVMKSYEIAAAARAARSK